MTTPFDNAVKKYLAENGRKGGKMNSREHMSKAGKASAAARQAKKPKCPCCLRPATVEQLAEVRKRLDAMGKATV